MNKPDSLFELIKSMTGSEKRYFRLHVGNEKVDYWILYLAIDQMETWSEVELRNQLSAEMVKALPDLKKYLYQLILKVLSNYETSQNPDLEIQQNLMKYEVLLRKNLTNQAGNLLEKTKQLCYKADKLYCLPEVLLRQMYFVQSGGQISIKAQHEHLETEYRQIVRYLQQEQTFNQVQWLLSSAETNNKAHDFEKAKVILDAMDTSIEFRYARKKFLGLQLRLNLVLAHLNEAYKASIVLLEIIETELLSGSEKSMREMAIALYWHLEICLKTQNYAEAVYWIEYIGKLPNSGRRSGFLKNKALVFHSLPTLAATGPEKLPELLPEMELILDEICPSLTDLEMARLHIILLKGWLMVGNEASAIKHINEIINKPNSEQFTEPYTIARFMQLIISIMRHDWALVHSQTVSLGRWLKTAKNLPESTLPLFRHLKNLSETEWSDTQLGPLNLSPNTGNDFFIQFLTNLAKAGR